METSEGATSSTAEPLSRPPPEDPSTPQALQGEEEEETVSHTELKRLFQEALGHQLQADPLLSDLHPQVTLEEVRALLELEHGRAMKVYVERGDGSLWGVVVPREASLRDLKTSLRHHVALMLARKGVKKKISWRYIWRTYRLSCNGEQLRDDNAKLLHLGVRNKSSLTFVKQYRERSGRGRAARPQ